WKNNGIGINTTLRCDIFIMRRKKVTAKNTLYVVMHILDMDVCYFANAFPKLIYHLKKFIEIFCYFFYRTFAIFCCHSCIMRSHSSLIHELKKMSKIVFNEFKIHILYFTQ